MSHQNPSKGTKVTTDPRSQNDPTVESAGPVAKDSIAAESQEFQSKNRNAEPLGVEGSKSTLANQDTSGAVELPPAPYAEAREPGDQPKYPDDAKNISSSNAAGSGDGQGNGDAAPTYVSNQYLTGGDPKGKDLKREEDLDDDPKHNASFTADIGSKDDPGRLAEAKFQLANSGLDTSAAVPAKAGQTDKGTYGVVGEN